MYPRISVDPDICHGQACVKGTRIPVHQIVRMLANGDTIEDLLEGNTRGRSFLIQTQPNNLLAGRQLGAGLAIRLVAHKSLPLCLGHIALGLATGGQQ